MSFISRFFPGLAVDDVEPSPVYFNGQPVAIPATARPQHPLLASAAVTEPSPQRRAVKSVARKGMQAWQRTALEAASTNETVSFAADTIETMARRIRFTVEEFTEGTWVESKDYNDVLVMLRDDSLSHEGLIGRAARILFLAGEVDFGIYNLDQLGHTVVYSTTELNHGDRWPAGRYSLLANEKPSLMVHAWNPDDIDASLPHSSLRAASKALAEIDLIDKLLAALIVSRLSGAGLLLVPDEVTFGDEVDDTADYIMTSLTAVGGLMLAHPESPESHVPITMSVPSEMIEKFRLLRFNEQVDEQLSGMREAAVRRVERAIDLPELLINGDTANHFALASTLEAASNYFVARAARRVAEAMTIAVLTPALELSDIGRYRIGVNLTGLVSRARAIAEALQLYDRGLLSERALVETAGYDASDMADKDEQAARALRALAMAQPQAFGRALMAQLGLDVEVDGAGGAGAGPGVGQDAGNSRMTGEAPL